MAEGILNNYMTGIRSVPGNVHDRTGFSFRSLVHIDSVSFKKPGVSCEDIFTFPEKTHSEPRKFLDSPGSSVGRTCFRSHCHGDGMVGPSFRRPCNREKLFPAEIT